MGVLALAASLLARTVLFRPWLLGGLGGAATPWSVSPLSLSLTARVLAVYASIPLSLSLSARCPVEPHRLAARPSYANAGAHITFSLSHPRSHTHSLTHLSSRCTKPGHGLPHIHFTSLSFTFNPASPPTTMLFAPLAALLGLAAPALATIYTTSPVAATVATAGQVLNVSWVDDGTSPNLTTIGVCSIDLCVGSTTQQTCLQNLGESVDVSLASYLTTTINATAGESGDYWFVRYTSTNYTNATTAEPYMQFSARFT